MGQITPFATESLDIHAWEYSLSSWNFHNLFTIKVGINLYSYIKSYWNIFHITLYSYIVLFFSILQISVIALINGQFRYKNIKISSYFMCYHYTRNISYSYSYSFHWIASFLNTRFAIELRLILIVRLIVTLCETGPRSASWLSIRCFQQSDVTSRDHKGPLSMDPSNVVHALSISLVNFMRDGTVFA